MRFKQVGNKRDTSYIVIKNAEASATIPLGAPVCWNQLAGTDDGLGVVLPSTLATAINATAVQLLLAGAAVAPGALISPGIANAAYGEAQVYGFCPDLLLTINTRSASSASWTSQTSIASGGFQQLIPETTGNGWTTAANQSFVTVSGGGTASFSNFLPYALLGQSVASQAASASTTADSRTIIQILVKGFLRIM